MSTCPHVIAKWVRARVRVVAIVTSSPFYHHKMRARMRAKARVRTMIMLTSPCFHVTVIALQVRTGERR